MRLNWKKVFVFGAFVVSAWPLVYSLALEKAEPTDIFGKVVKPNSLSSSGRPSGNSLLSAIVPRHPGFRVRVRPGVKAPNAVKNGNKKRPKKCKRSSLSARADCEGDDEDDEDDEDYDDEGDSEESSDSHNDDEIMEDASSSEERNRDSDQDMNDGSDAPEEKPSGSEQDPLTWAIYVEKGQAVLQKMDTRVGAYRNNPQSTPDRPLDKLAFTPGNSESPNGGYSYTPSSPASNMVAGMTMVKKDLGIDHLLESFSGAKIRSIDDQGKESLVAQNFFSPADKPDGVIWAAWNYLSDRHNFAPENKKIKQWSDLIYQTMIRNYGDQSKEIPTMRYIVRDEISNRGSQATVETAHAKVKAGERAVFDLSSTNAQEIEAIRGLLGSANGKGIAHLLSDYPNAFKGKKIVKIHSWHKENDITELVFELGD